MKNKRIGFESCFDCGSKKELTHCICTISGGLFGVNKSRVSTQLYCPDCLKSEKHKHEGQIFA